MSEAVQNIEYFRFVVEPLSGESSKKISSIRNGEFINFLKLLNEFPECEIIEKDKFLFEYFPPIKTSDEDELVGVIKEDDFEILNVFTLKNEDTKYYSGSDGILVINDKKIEFIPLSYDCLCQIILSDDTSRAYATFYPAMNDGKVLTEEDVIEEIKNFGIAVRPDYIRIQAAIKELNETNQIINDLIVAEGTEPVPGQPGRIEYHFETELQTGPAVDDSGHIDFYNLNLLESVEKDQTIAVYTPTVQGTPGVDVFGQEILPEKLKELKPPRGANLYTNEEDPNTFLSKIDGYIVYRNDEITITNEYNIRGDVDFHTGNIISKGSLNVNGNVKSGFKLQMSENIKIGGYVKDANITTGGIINVLGGFSGNGDGVLKAGKNVLVRYVRNQTIYSGGDILVEKEVVDSKLYAKGKIASQSGKMMLIGGYSLAAGNIEVKELGHEYNIPTKVEVGHDFGIFDEIKEITVKVEQIKEELVKLKEQIEKLTVNGKPLTGTETVFKTLISQFQKRKLIFTQLKEQRKALKDTITSSSGCKVIVTGTVYPGVMIVIDGMQFKITEIMKNKVFSLASKENGIVITSNS